MRYVYIIGNEHQLTQVYASISHFNVLLEDITLLIQDLKSDNALYNKVINESQFGEVIAFPNWTFSDILKFNTKSDHFIHLCEELKLKYKEIFFFASHYSDDSTLIALNLLKPEKFYLMDEGTASYTVLERRNSSDLLFKTKLLFKSIIYRKYIHLPYSLIYFTKFNFTAAKGDTKEVYKIEKIKNVVKSFTNQFAFLGSSIVELSILSLNVYLFFLKTIANRNSDKELLYFSHRKEDSDKLEAVERIGYKVIKLDEPFERYFSINVDLPDTLGSFYTTSVLINISENFVNVPNLEVYSFSVKELRYQKKVFQNVLTYIRSDPKIRIINLEI